jgi:hypothetical protein
MVLAATVADTADDNKEGACRYGTNIPAYYAAWPDGEWFGSAANEGLVTFCLGSSVGMGTHQDCNNRS